MTGGPAARTEPDGMRMHDDQLDVDARRTVGEVLAGSGPPDGLAKTRQ